MLPPASIYQAAMRGTIGRRLREERLPIVPVPECFPYVSYIKLVVVYDLPLTVLCKHSYTNATRACRSCAGVLDRIELLECIGDRSAGHLSFCWRVPPEFA